MSTSPTTRSLEWCRKRSWPCQKVEYWNSFARRRIDLFGVIDILALDEYHGCLGIQCTTTGNLSSRMAKARASEPLQAWIQHGNRFEVHGWAVRGPRGKRKLWTLTRRMVVSWYDAEEIGWETLPSD